ncbi:MAG: 2-hydroxyacyl-CoA dehydratase family protein [Anaerolineae bacterium]|nr:2-hydroxyacyl-CoA dehydratase family protein [Anaerolineae bacterium]
MHRRRTPLGFLTAYVPEELFHAAGFEPVFIFHAPEEYGKGRAHLPGFVCWVVMSALDQALAGALDRLGALALAKTCDATQGLADLWRRNVPQIPLFHFGMPSRLEGPAVKAYLMAELRDLRDRVEAFTGCPIAEHALWDSIAYYNRLRATVRAAYARVAEYAPSAFYAALRDLLRSHRPALPGPSPLPNAPRLILVGPALGDPVLFEVVEQVGARIVGDLFDLGERYFEADAAENGDPLEAIAERLGALTPTPTKYHAAHSRAARLLEMVRERNADGVIFARQKFCEPHGFDYVRLACALDRAGVPHLMLELEQASQAGQLRTRVEAFVEMIRGV